MKRAEIEQEIKKFNPNVIHYYDSRVIYWDNESPILLDELMSKLSDDEIEGLYINLKIGVLVEQFGIKKCKKIFNEFDARGC